jgi:DNA-binding PadR family transcriptional regulator
MIPSSDVLQVLHLADPHPLPEMTIRAELGERRGGRQIGLQELADALKRLSGYRYIVATQSLDGDQVWALTPEGRTEAQKRFR